MQGRFRLWWQKMILALFVGLWLAGLVPVTEPVSVQAQTAPPRTAFVHLFEWKWTDIAQECENYLGPKGFAAVQVSPPSEHAIINQNGNYPWWERYQTVGYSLGRSRSGTLAEFQNMVTRCHNVGVDVYVDAVINHMTAQSSGTGSNGTSYTKYNYPGLYQFQDFHADSVNSPEYCARDIAGSDYSTNPSNAVRRCELVGLADLNTSSTYVRQTIANYLISVANMGVRGFRIDAAKHMNPEDISDIISRVNAAVSPAPYFYLEVIDKDGSEAVKASDYFNVASGTADIHEFKYGIKVSGKFRNNGSEKLADLSTFGTTWGLMPSDKGIAFLDNHDEQRTGTANYLTYKDGQLYTLANVFMLAWPYGYPQIMSSYDFSNNDQGPPSDSNGNTNSIYPAGSSTPNCFTIWKCEHRWRPVGNMVAFRNNTQSNFSVTNWWDNGSNQIAFGRGDKGFVVINRQDNTSLSRTFQTSMPAGTYCDVIHGDFSNGACSGPTVTVNAAGQATISVNAWDAVAIHAGAKVTSTVSTVAITFKATVSQTVVGQEVYVVGDIPVLGGWNTSQAIHLTTTASTFPVWTVTANLPANTPIQYKYIIKDGSGNVTWENGANRTYTTPASGSATLNDSWHF
jgi:alpha-amylase